MHLSRIFHESPQALNEHERKSRLKQLARFNGKNETTTVRSTTTTPYILLRIRNSAIHSIVTTTNQGHKPSTVLAIMSLRNKVFQTIPFDASSDVNEALIAAGDAEEEDHRLLEEKIFSRFQFSYRLLGMLVGFFGNSSTLGVNAITIWGEDALTKSKTDFFVFSLLCTFIFSAIAFAVLGFLRNLVAITYTAIGGRSKELLEEMVLHMEFSFVVGALVGVSLAWTMRLLCWP
jgi:hypothetical protein